MSRLIDADALERDGWRMSRIVQIDEKTMEAQTRKPTDFPTIEPEIRGKWERNPNSFIESYRCTCCGQKVLDNYWNYCPNCGADMREK